MNIIIRHKNRKFYNRNLKGYTTLLDIVQAVKDGDEFIVFNTRGEDVTEETLNAAIYKHLIIPSDKAATLIKELYEVDSVVQS